ncbi:hypothetical protein PmNV_066 [Penaeus monodon nudivirus]|uniref:Uncharacterized protein n=2 Tax=Lefavirales TaxID=2840070 RepID=A0A076FER0_9VIRU|nr:hypothetical protein PmNV_066 [Penaeus monodon nudivirus]AII15854.1 hypothetical protein PmNV_066 [Penaeus monodon nudivirus]
MNSCKKIKSFVIKLDDDSDDDTFTASESEDDILMIDNDDTDLFSDHELDMNNDEDKSKNEIVGSNEEELRKVDCIIKDAEFYIQNDNYKLHDVCKLIKSDINCIRSKEIFNDEYSRTIKKSITLEHSVIKIPYYLDRVAFSQIMWIPFNSNSNMNNKLKNVQLDFLARSNPAKWIYKEVDESISSRKSEWLKTYNDAVKNLPCTLLGQDSGHKNTHFIVMEFNYLLDGGLSKGLCGLCVCVCRLNEENVVEIVDIANLKISCNASNRCYGDVFETLKKYAYVPIFIYIPQAQHYMYSSYLYPWSVFMSHYVPRFYNLITKIKMSNDRLKFVEAHCLDKDIHYDKSCAICNCLKLVYKIANNQFECRRLSEAIDNSLKSNLDVCRYPVSTVCNGKYFYSHGSSTSSMFYKYCMCTNE